MVAARLGRGVPRIGGLTILLGGAGFVEMAEDVAFVPIILGRATGSYGVGGGGSSMMFSVGVGVGIGFGVGFGVAIDEGGEGKSFVSGRVHITSTMTYDI